MVIVPLAAAVQMHASAITLPDGSAHCETDSNFTSACPTSPSATALPGSVLTGFDLNLGSGFLFSARGSGGIGQPTWPSTWTVTLTASGGLSGPLSAGQVLPVAFNFGLNSEDSTSFGWNLEFELGTSATPALYGSQTFSGSESGSGGLTVNSNIASGSPLLETVVLSVTGIETDYSTFPPAIVLTNPDFQFQAISPEPATLANFVSSNAASPIRCSTPETWATPNGVLRTTLNSIFCSIASSHRSGPTLAARYVNFFVELLARPTRTSMTAPDGRGSIRR
jgi:hypothetical protein